MLVSYKGKKVWIISLIAIFLDGIISYYFDGSFHHLNYFYPMLTVSLIPFLKNNLKDYYRLSCILGMIYDLLYSHLFLFNTFLFFLLSKIDSKILKSFKENLLSYLFLVILNILVYDMISFLLIFFTQYQRIGINDYFYKIEHSLILNIGFSFIYFFFFKKSVKFKTKYRKVS